MNHFDAFCARNAKVPVFTKLVKDQLFTGNISVALWEKTPTCWVWRENILAARLKRAKRTTLEGLYAFDVNEDPNDRAFTERVPESNFIPAVSLRDSIKKMVS